MLLQPETGGFEALDFDLKFSQPRPAQVGPPAHILTGTKQARDMT